jgi:hypothetical protein
MSYEQKYLKYKQKYQELKRQQGGGAHKLETDNEFVLTDTPTINNINLFITNQAGGANDDTEFNLTDTPALQLGGSVLAPATVVPSVPMPCTGVVNPAPVVDMPVIPTVVSSKNYSQADVEELNSTTELSDIQNTEDLVNLFNNNQHGNGRRQRRSSRSSRSSKSSRSQESDLLPSKHLYSKKINSSSSSLSSSSLSSSDSLSELDSDSD